MIYIHLNSKIKKVTDMLDENKPENERNSYEIAALSLKGTINF
tara:strand:- start:376 stop:504 length:129 start_codon:yes stop_codon:yes gene_type:complete